MKIFAWLENVDVKSAVDVEQEESVDQENADIPDEDDKRLAYHYFLEKHSFLSSSHSSISFIQVHPLV